MGYVIAILPVVIFGIVCLWEMDKITKELKIELRKSSCTFRYICAERGEFCKECRLYTKK